ncbi:hypothetical protein KQX54_005237 [Cotesia glomerata]|uniref:Nucleolar protein 4 n=1 Tax=Cotesia glomerata TaxID=32391 RepID=A0AAV7HHD3_COTGL|nr:hypothetical protein KQX54_005237 [Cotesia glomerata]
MASATMGLRRRVPVNNPTASHHPAPSKRSRSENNNNPSHGNLNSLGARDDQPAAKKSRSGLAARTNANSSANTTEGGHGKRNGSKSRGKSPLQSSQPVAVTVASPACTNVNVNVNVGHVSEADISGGFNVLTPSPWSVPTSLCPMPPTIPYMATFVGNATNLNKNSSVSYLDISNMTSGSLSGTAPVSAGAPVSSSGSGAASSVAVVSPANGKMNGFGSNCGKTDNKSAPNNANGCSSIPFPGVVPSPGMPYVGKLAQSEPSPVKFQNDSMYNAYQPWVIKTYGDLAKTKTITIKKYGRILRTLRGEEVNSAENSKFRFWVKSKGFHIGQPEGYDAKPADRIIGRHAVTSPGLDPPLSWEFITGKPVDDDNVAGDISRKFIPVVAGGACADLTRSLGGVERPVEVPEKDKEGA